VFKPHLTPPPLFHGRLHQRTFGTEISEQLEVWVQGIKKAVVSYLHLAVAHSGALLREWHPEHKTSEGDLVALFDQSSFLQAQDFVWQQFSY